MSSNQTRKLFFSLPIQQLVLLILIPSLLLVIFVVGTLVYSQLYQTILAGFDKKLIAVSSTVAAFTDTPKLERLIFTTQQPNVDPHKIEMSSAFLSLVAPLRQIKTATNLTYLYTYILGGKKGIVYILDASTDEHHSLIGDEDVIPAHLAADIRTVFTDGKILTSGIQVWEQWGLFKSGFAPVRNNNEHTIAIVGADVNITAIKARTRIVLFNVGMVGVISVLVSIFIAVSISRRLAQPLQRIKYAALQIAAGELGVRIQVHGIKELIYLTESFNYMSESLTQKFNSLTQYNYSTEVRRRQQELTKYLIKITTEPSNHLLPTWIKIAYLNSESITSVLSLPAPDDKTAILETIKHTASGWHLTPDYLIIWLAISTQPPLHILRQRLDMMTIIKTRITEPHQQSDMLINQLQSYLNETIYAFVVVDIQRATVRVIGRAGVAGIVFNRTSATSALFSNDEIISLPPEGGIAFLSGEHIAIDRLLAASSTNMAMWYSDTVIAQCSSNLIQITDGQIEEYVLTVIRHPSSFTVAEQLNYKEYDIH